MASLSEDLMYVFYHPYSMPGRYPSHTNGKYLKVPIKGDVFELPVYAVEFLRSHIEQGSTAKTFVIPIKPVDDRSGYSTVPTIVKYALRTCDTGNTGALHRIDAKGLEAVYYTSYGCIYNEELHPIVMFAWEMERQPEGSGYTYTPVQPIVRIDPEYILRKDDAVAKFISGQFFANLVKASLGEEHIEIPHSHSVYTLENSEPTPRCTNIKIIVDSIPYKVVDKVTPTGAELTNEVLLNTAINHLDSIVL